MAVVASYARRMRLLHTYSGCEKLFWKLRLKAVTAVVYYILQFMELKEDQSTCVFKWHLKNGKNKTIQFNKIENVHLKKL